MDTTLALTMKNLRDDELQAIIRECRQRLRHPAGEPDEEDAENQKRAAEDELSARYPMATCVFHPDPDRKPIPIGDAAEEDDTDEPETEEELDLRCHNTERFERADSLPEGDDE